MSAHRLVSLDPGIRGCGVAFFQDDTLVSAAYVKNTYAASGNGPRECAAMALAVARWWAVDEDPGVLAFEWPQVYRAGKLKGDPNDLLPLVHLAGVLVGLWRGTVPTAYRPHDWKQTMTKEVCRKRIEARLTPSEHRAVEKTECAPSLMHNVWDAVGIGMHHLGRMTPRRVIAR